jgi:Zn-dependent protease with chaperone function
VLPCKQHTIMRSTLVSSMLIVFWYSIVFLLLFLFYFRLLLPLCIDKLFYLSASFLICVSRVAVSPPVSFHFSFEYTQDAGGARPLNPKKKAK